MASNRRIIECEVTTDDKRAIERFRDAYRLSSSSEAARLLLRRSLGLIDNADGTAEAGPRRRFD